MCTVTLSYDKDNVKAQEQLAALLATGLFISEFPTPNLVTKNQVYIEDGKVKVDFVSDTMSIEEARELTLKAVDLEYSLP